MMNNHLFVFTVDSKKGDYGRLASEAEQRSKKSMLRNSVKICDVTMCTVQSP